MTDRPRLADVSIATLVLALGQAEVWWGIGATHRQGPAWAQASAYALAAVALAWRRVHPFWTLVAVASVLVVEFAAVGAPEGNGVVMTVGIAAYSQARWERRYPWWWGAPVVIATGAAWILLDPLTQTWAERIAAAVWVSLLVIAWLVGALVRTAAGAAENRRLARAEGESRARAEERNRIARELHDAVGHSVSVMTMQAAAVRRRLSADQTVEREALESVEQVGREAMSEMRRLVGVLRQDSEPVDREPPSTVAALPRLIDGFRAAGLTVELESRGELADLPPGIGLTVYRVVQEALTNVVRHAHDPRAAYVTLHRQRDAVTVTVRDDGTGDGPPPAPGHGLTGMRERIDLYGGTLTVGRSPVGFVLTATIPVVEA